MRGAAPRRFRRGRRAGAAAAGLLAALAVTGPVRAAAAAPPGCTPVLGASTTSPAQLAGWFATTGRQPRLDVSVLDLATMFVEEGAREGVKGDIAFAQSIVETGYFGFSPSVAPQLHNYAGIGATGGGVKGAAFPDARVGVRAQVQHLRAYADSSLRSAADLKAPLVDPRFGFLVPNAQAIPCWEQFGNGIWAADPTGYGVRVLSVHQRIAAFPSPAAAPAPPVAAPVATTVPAPAEAEAVSAVAVAAVSTAPDPSAVWGAPGDSTLLPAPSLARAQPGGGGGVGATLAAGLTGMCLLSICTTLWWHGRRFAKAG